MLEKARNWLIILAIMLTPQMVVEATVDRGYFAIGGEWLLIPLILLSYLVIKSFIDFIKGAEEIDKRD
ncbi:hypothetical protein EKH84_15675 [Cellulosilyticum sp. WCF-2]|nr:hypothetical protein EKH84_15675 [Cellulosilyticum sp. WCF-2]